MAQVGRWQNGDMTKAVGTESLGALGPPGLLGVRAGVWLRRLCGEVPFGHCCSLPPGGHHPGCDKPGKSFPFSIKGLPTQKDTLLSHETELPPTGRTFRRDVVGERQVQSTPAERLYRPQPPRPVWGVGPQPDLAGAGTEEGSRRPQVMSLFLVRMLVPHVCSLSEN